MTLVPSHIPGVCSPQVPAAPAAAYLVTNQRGRSRASHPECGSSNANAAPRPQTALSAVPSFKAFPGASLSEHRTTSRTISGPHADPREPPSNDKVVYNAADAPPHDESARACPDWRGAFGIPAVKGTFVKWALQVSASKGLFEGDLIVYTLAAHLTTVGNIPVKYHFDPEESEDVPIPPIDAMILAYVELESDEDNNFILAADVHDAPILIQTTPK
ncbi:hypothetical protein B0H17DRAFT_1218567 [Mycena rosella]|uniref:Uncharacterized protein n=1 Tax=Mycena rosella TaxID=1033263 RepID=A0AAD7BP97_MYCRO|nr:hypothetical protein B0H17DRAFT_1218567 [Mycena rosella]